VTRQDAWSGSFHELLTLDEPRTDTPLHLPEAPPAPPCADPWCPPHETTMRRQQETNSSTPPQGTRIPEHCSASAQICAAGGATIAQQRRMVELATRTGAKLPDNADSLTEVEARSWLGRHWARFMAQDAPPKLTSIPFVVPK
jgi:hypothetical protein